MKQFLLRLSIAAVIVFSIPHSHGDTKVITNESLVNPGTTTSKVVALQCGKKRLITNVEPYPAGCVLIREHDLNPVPVEK